MYARECTDATDTFQETDQEWTPIYGLVPTGLIFYRGYVVDTLSEWICCRTAVRTSYEPNESTA